MIVTLLLGAAALSSMQSGLSVIVDASAVPAGRQRASSSFEIVARRTTATAHERSFPVSLAPATATAVRLELAPGEWALSARGSGLWSPAIVVRVEPGGAVSPTARLKIWPTAKVSARWRTGTKAPDGRVPSAPKEVVAHFRGTQTVPRDQAVPNSSTRCDARASEVTCTVPASRLDVRLLAPGLIPEYYWHVAPPPDQTLSLGEFRVESGASVIGYVRGNDRAAASARVELLTPGGARIPTAGPLRPSRDARPADLERSRYPLLTATNQRGFFQVRKVTPGQYSVVATTDDGSAAETAVQVVENSESALPDFLLLEAPFSLDVSVDPPRHPDGEPWTVTLLRLTPVQGLRSLILTDFGSARFERIGRGHYALEVSARGEKWLSQSVQIDEQAGPLLISITPVPVKGRVLLGGKPIKATVNLGGHGGPQVITLESNDDGEFEGVLPRAGGWPLWIFSSSTEPPIDRVMRSVEVTPDAAGRAELTIDLEDARLTGRVVDEQNRGVKAIVTLSPVERGDTRSHQQVFTDADGLFKARGLAPGTYMAEAQAESRRSVPVTVERAEDGADVTLVVKAIQEIEARVLSGASNQPLPGARAMAFASDQYIIGSPVMAADSEGRLKLRLPAGSTGVDILYWADGHAMRMAREPVVPGREMLLPAAPTGGRLIVSVPARLREPNAASSLVLLHQGTSMAVQTVEAMARRRAVMESGPPVVGDGSRISLPDMDPGEYALCEISRATYLANRKPSPGRGCIKGILSPGGELALALEPSTGTSGTE